VNERIRQLAEQAETKEVGYYFFDREKFAELIVRECAEIALRENHDPYECILKHFGLDTTETVDETLQRRSTYYGNNP